MLKDRYLHTTSSRWLRNSLRADQINSVSKYIAFGNDSCSFEPSARKKGMVLKSNSSKTDTNVSSSVYLSTTYIPISSPTALFPHSPHPPPHPTPAASKRAHHPNISQAISSNTSPFQNQDNNQHLHLAQLQKHNILPFIPTTLSPNTPPPPHRPKNPSSSSSSSAARSAHPLSTAPRAVDIESDIHGTSPSKRYTTVICPGL